MDHETDARPLHPPLALAQMMHARPESLRKLVFGTGFNQPIEKCR